MHNLLQPVLIVLATAVLALVVFRLLRLQPVLGYLLAGVVIGPHALDGSLKAMKLVTWQNLGWFF